ncbi:hypothetical protein ACHQM5_014111 [Ranunculus cassubicifolius]
MAKLSLLFSLSVCFLVLFHAQARPQFQGQQGQWQGQSQCQIQNIDAIQPTRRVQAEAGVTEHWDQNSEQLNCAGVAVVRHTIQPRGLLLPQYNNAPKISYVIQGRGMHGVAIPGCPETHVSVQQSEQQQYQGEQGESQQQSSRRGDQHQKVDQIRQGDMLATPVGVPCWLYNDGETPLVVITLIDTSNNENQLDRNPRGFYLAGNPQRQEQSMGQESRESRERQQEHSSNNIFSGFDDQMLAEVFGVNTETARKLRGENDRRGHIIQVQNELQILIPRRSREQQEFQGQGQISLDNGVEESLCNIKLRTNMDKPSRADVYNPRAGRINRVNGRKLSILRQIRLNAERGVLYRNALVAPQWNQNAHSVIYVTRGSAQVQIVGNYQQAVFDGELRQGQLIVVPQNFAVMAQAKQNGFDWISFKTNDQVISNTIAGRNSAIRAMPQEILMNAYRISSEEARRLKFNREEVELFAPRSESMGRELA